MLFLYRMPRPPKGRKMNEFNAGLSRLLNDPRTTPFTDVGNTGFKTLIKESGMSLTEVCRHVGRGKKAPKPKESDLSAERIETLENETNQN